MMNMAELAGKDWPEPALPAQMVAAVSFGQPDSIIQGIVMVPTVAEFATELPETRPNRALARTETYAEPPRRRPMRELRISTSSPMMPVFAMMADMNTKSMVANRISSVAASYRAEPRVVK